MQKLHHLAASLLILGFMGCQTVPQPSPTSYLELTKQQIIARLGTPAFLDLAEGRPEPEMWVYYEKLPSGRVRSVSLLFQRGRCIGSDALFDPSHFLSPDRPEDVAQILAYQRTIAGWGVPP